MNKIIIRTKSNHRFQTMRASHLGEQNKKHQTTDQEGKRPHEYVSWGFNQKVINEFIMPKISKKINDDWSKINSAIIYDDFTFEQTNALIDKGVNNITVVFIVADKQDKINIREWLEEFIGIEQLHIIYLTKKNYILPNGFYKNGKAKKDIIITKWNAEELEEMKYVNLIINNGPYGAIGAEITEVARDSLDYDLFVNLLPANDYKRNKTKDLFNYQSEMETIPNAFDGDAAVTTHVAKIHKNKVNDMTLDEFEISNYTDKSLFKYFTENRIRKHYAIDAANLSGATDKQFKQFDINKTVTVSSRDVNHKHLPYSKTCETYRYNVLKDITNEEIFESRKATRNGIYDGWLSITGILNNTEIEKNNQVAFMYGQDGFRFLAKIFTAANADSTLNFGKVFPKVDWTRSWTVEEILADYGYTEEEAKEVMEDLNNYKGMED